MGSTETHLTGNIMCFFNFSKCVMLKFKHKKVCRVEKRWARSGWAVLQKTKNSSCFNRVLSLCHGYDKGRDISRTQSKWFANHNALDQLTIQNTFCASEGGVSSKTASIKQFMKRGAAIMHYCVSLYGNLSRYKVEIASFFLLLIMQFSVSGSTGIFSFKHKPHNCAVIYILESWFCSDCYLWDCMLCDCQVRCSETSTYCTLWNQCMFY